MELLHLGKGGMALWADEDFISDGDNLLHHKTSHAFASPQQVLLSHTRFCKLNNLLQNQQIDHISAPMLPFDFLLYT